MELGVGFDSAGLPRRWIMLHIIYTGKLYLFDSVTSLRPQTVASGFSPSLERILIGIVCS